MKEVESYLTFLKNPFVIIMSIFIGVYLGIFYQPLSQALAPIGDVYLNLLQMCVLPILISAIISNIARLANSNSVKNLIPRIMVVFLFSVLIVSIFGVGISTILGPGKSLTQEQKDTLGVFIQTSENDKDIEISLSEPYVAEEEDTILDFFAEMVPKNVFSALSTGNTIELVFFCILLGVAIGLLRDYTGESFITFSTSVFLAFQKIINWIMYLLPIGLISLVAEQVRTTGLELVLAVLKLIIVFYCAGITMYIINTLIIWGKSKNSLLEVISVTLEPFIIAFTTRSSYATIPSAVQCLEGKLYFERSTTNLIIPIGITLLRYGNILYFAIVSVFIAQLYDVNFGISEIAITVIASIIAGVATAGATGFATVYFVSIVLNPLGIPYEAVIIILLAIDTILDPMRTAIIVHTNIMSTSLIANIYHGDRLETD